VDDVASSEAPHTRSPSYAQLAQSIHVIEFELLEAPERLTGQALNRDVLMTTIWPEQLASSHRLEAPKLVMQLPQGGLGYTLPTPGAVKIQRR
jgi:hypothetical protein